MFKIKDRVALGVLAGLCGNLTKTAIDELSFQIRISQRSFRETASGVWVSKKQARRSAFPQNKVRPKDAASNLSYMVSHAAYGLVTTYVAAKLGDPSLYDTQPQNDFLEPTIQTTEQAKKYRHKPLKYRRTQKHRGLEAQVQNYVGPTI